MQGAAAPRGQGRSPSKKDTLGLPWVVPLTYVLAALELTCLFMQFSILPVRRPARGARGALAVLPGGLGSVPAPGGRLQPSPARRPPALRLPPAWSLHAHAARVHCPAIVALVANLLGAIISVTCIPASTKGATVDVQAPPPGGPKASVFDLKAISRLLLLPGVLPVFLIKVVSGFPSGLFMIMFSIISMDFFQLGPSQAGYLMSFFGVLQMVVQGLVIGRLSSHFSEEALLRASVLVFMVVGLAMALMSTVLHFCFLVPGLVFSLCTLNVVTDSMLTKAVSASDTGTMLGLCASVQPLTRTLGPTLGGLLYRSFGVPIFGHVQFAVNFFLLLVLWRKPMTHKRDKAW
ncbi:solute carrier family 22 member 18 isoform X2 [Marmota monax]|uniref:solute carrier family 22 member 18 isoform X2 n=1 Tax=Marmota monax TaxID=9995 RepID=UPI001EAFAAB6|nr:solute carrier family 22 member 18 isoform X2 [Marmota monax]